LSDRRVKETVRKSNGFPAFPTSNHEESLGVEETRQQIVRQKSEGDS